LAEARLQEGESIESALRRFKRKVQTQDIIKEVKRHSFYLKPGAKRRVKEALARKRARKRIGKSRIELFGMGRCSGSALPFRGLPQ
jgi:small subunit ribosomal protein S21